jgi:3-hydroxyacyl-CoA dehydrogenase
MHFFNPPHLMKLVEVISGAATALKMQTLFMLLLKKW